MSVATGTIHGQRARGRPTENGTGRRIEEK